MKEYELVGYFLAKRKMFNDKYGHAYPKDDDKEGWESYGKIQGMCYILSELGFLDKGVDSDFGGTRYE